MREWRGIGQTGPVKCHLEYGVAVERVDLIQTPGRGCAWPQAFAPPSSATRANNTDTVRPFGSAIMLVLPSDFYCHVAESPDCAAHHSFNAQAPNVALS